MNTTSNHAEVIVNKMCQLLSLKNKRNLAIHFGIKQNLINGWIKRKSVPFKYVERISKKANVPVDAILHEELIISEKEEFKVTIHAKQKARLSEEKMKEFALKIQALALQLDIDIDVLYTEKTYFKKGFK